MQSLHLLLLAGLTSLASSQFLNNATSTNTTCKNYQIISTRGSLEPQGPSEAFPQIINQTMTAIPNGTTHDTIYPASIASNSSSIGTKNLVNYIRTTNEKCPFQKFILLGYSQGAGVTAGALQQICPESPEGAAILAVLTVGNPGHKAFEASNSDEAGGKSTDMFFGSLYKNGSPTVPSAWYSSGVYLDICRRGDLVCMPTAAALGDAVASHLSYGNDTGVQELGARFLVNRLYSAGLAPITPEKLGIN